MHHVFGHVGFKMMHRTLEAWRPDLAAKVKNIKWCSADLSGPFKPEADPVGYKYIQIMIEDITRFIELELLKAKSDA